MIRSPFSMLLISFVLLSTSLSFGLQTATRGPLTKTINYYGSQFYALLSEGGKISSEELKTEIKNVLHMGHIKTSGFDKLIANCEKTPDCYTHTVIGYKAARTFLLGNFYLKKENDQYLVRDVYCNHEYGPDEFPHGSEPAPEVIPASTVINVEHTWPQSRFTKMYANEMQKSDLHHLFPTDSQMNSTRGSFKFGEVVKDKQILKCPISRFGSPQDSNETVFEPPKEHRGNVARALFYFSLKYDLSITPTEEATLRKWDQEDPIDAEETQRNEAIFNSQKSRNPFVDIPGLAGSIADF